MQRPVVFISYSHDSPDHKNWVYAFASDLMLNGVEAILDQWDLLPGQDIVEFMHSGIARADKVLLVCTLSYVEKADGGSGGVGYEKLIVSAELASKTDSTKFIPIVRSNSAPRKLPKFMGHRLHLDFESDDDYASSLQTCLRAIRGLALRDKPVLGAVAVPDLIQSRQVRGLGPPLLSRLEVEALSWTMEGKTAWEVSKIIGITEADVQANLQGAMSKLGSTNKHQAVLKALRLGLIN